MVPEAEGPDPDELGEDEPWLPPDDELGEEDPWLPLDGDPLCWLPPGDWPDSWLGMGIVAGLPEDGLLELGDDEDCPPGEELGEGMLEDDPPPLGDGIPEEPPPLGEGGEGIAVPPEDGWVGVEDDGQPASSSEAAARTALVAPRREIRSGLAMVGTP